MKLHQHARKLATVLLGAALTFYGAAPSAADGVPATIKIAIEGAFPPFNYVDSNNKLQGFDYEIATALCEAAKAHCEFVVEAWSDMIPDLLANHYDAIISSMSMSAERRQKVAFSDKYYDSPSVFITRKDSKLTGTSPADLKGVKVGVTLATSQETYVKKFYGDAQVTVFSATPQLYAGLADGSVDIIMEDKLAVYDWLTNTKAGSCCEFKGADIKDVTYFGEGAGIALRPADTKLRETFNAALAQLKEDGTYDMINAKYFPFSIQ